MFGRCLLCHADAGEGAQQTIQSIRIGLTVFCQESNTAYLVSKCIGNAKTCSRAKHAAAGICHRHFNEARIRRDIADAAVRLCHEHLNPKYIYHAEPCPAVILISPQKPGWT